MKILFVHGMGRSPLSAWPMLRALRREGFDVQTFRYSAALSPFDRISRRLQHRIADLADGGEYAVVAHSLGGVIVRHALNALPPHLRRPSHVFLLGSPQKPSRLAARFGAVPLFRAVTGDCGQLLGSEERMAQVRGLAGIPVTNVVGTKDLPVFRRLFADEVSSDGIVAYSESSADWLKDEVRVPVVHTLLPVSRAVTDVIVRRLRS